MNAYQKANQSMVVEARRAAANAEREAARRFRLERQISVLNVNDTPHQPRITFGRRRSRSLSSFTEINFNHRGPRPIVNVEIHAKFYDNQGRYYHVQGLVKRTDDGQLRASAILTNENNGNSTIPLVDLIDLTDDD